MACPEQYDLSVSVVVYRSNPEQLATTLASLGAAYQALRSARSSVSAIVYLVDNCGSLNAAALFEMLRAHDIECQLISGQCNVGYGRGHNLALARTTSRYHLVLNPDIELERQALAEAFAFLDAHLEVGLLVPHIADENGHSQYLCRRYPTLLDLFIRGFLPARMGRWFAHRLAEYEMRDLINERDVVWGPLIVSGCFMLFRTETLKRLNGFDARYFLYFEDYDLSLRTHQVAQVVYLPAVRIVHYGGGASRKGHEHIYMFMTSAYKFFNRFGWRGW